MQSADTALVLDGRARRGSGRLINERHGVTHSVPNAALSSMAESATTQCTTVWQYAFIISMIVEVWWMRSGRVRRQWILVTQCAAAGTATHYPSATASKQHGIKDADYSHSSITL